MLQQRSTWCPWLLLGLGLVSGCAGQAGLGGSGGGVPVNVAHEVWLAPPDAGVPMDVGGWQVTLTVAALWVGPIQLGDAGTSATASLDRSGQVDLRSGSVLLGTASGPPEPYRSVSVQLGRLNEGTLTLAGSAQKAGVVKAFGSSFTQRERIGGIPIVGEPGPGTPRRLFLEPLLWRWVEGIDFEGLPVKAASLDLNDFPQAHNAVVRELYSPSGFRASWE